MEEKMINIDFKLNPVWHGEYTDVLVDLGYALEKGACFAQDYQSALFLYSIAAKAGNPQAINNMGRLYANGLGVEKDLERAVSLYEDAASRGNTDAMDNLGDVYAHGLLTGKPDYRKAFNWCREAADLGDTEGLFSVANCYHWGWGTKQNREKAFRIFRRLFENGYTHAAFYMGLYHQEGIAVQRDYDKALRYYWIGASEDCGYCWNQLGEMYANGPGVEKDLPTALSYYRRAADLDDETACLNLGWYYEFKKKQPDEAIRWYRKGAQLGNDWCVKRLEKLEAPMEEEKPTESI